jgi:tryptophanase
LKSQKELGAPIPANKSLVVRNIKQVTREQREYALIKTEYNMFSFPADLLFVDFLSDSGSGTMTDLQWAALFHGDESYARNKGYYVLLDAVRDTFERGDDPKRIINLILSGETDVQKLMDEIYLTSYEGGFVNGGVHQLTRPNAFIVPQGRCAENLLFSTIAQILREEDPNKDYYIPSNGHFDTTEANIAANGIIPVNLFSTNLLDDFPFEEMDKINPFNGNMDIERLEELIQKNGEKSVPLIYVTITNNTAAGQPVSMSNVKAVNRIANQYGIPLFLDACRFAENANFIKEFEKAYKNRTVASIVQEMFSYVDGFTISFKKDGLANIGGGFFFKDKGVFHNRFSIKEDIGIKLKEKQILIFGNDSYGGMSGRSLMAIAVGLYEVTQESYLNNRKTQIREFARQLAKNGIPVILPVGGHAVYLNMDKFLEDTKLKLEDFGGVGFTIELLRHYGIRAAELGPFAFEFDNKTPEQRKGILNLVRLAVPRNLYGQSHFNYAVAAITELHHNREQIPKVVISRGKELHLRHFQTGLQPVYKKKT